MLCWYSRQVLDHLKLIHLATIARLSWYLPSKIKLVTSKEQSASPIIFNITTAVYFIALILSVTWMKL